MTEQQAAKFAAWCQHALGLEDWSVELALRDDPPAWACADSTQVGACATNRSYKKAKIWVSIARSEDDETDPLGVLGHEMLHMAASDTGIEQEAATNDGYEFLWNRLGDLMAAAYRAKVKLQQ